VEVEFVDGNRVRIGTDDPHGLATGIRAAVSRSQVNELDPDQPMSEPEVLVAENSEPDVMVVQISEFDFGDAPRSDNANLESNNGPANRSAGESVGSGQPSGTESQSSANGRGGVGVNALTSTDVSGEAGSKSQAGANGPGGVGVNALTSTDVSGEAGSTRAGAETDFVFPEPSTDPTRSGTGDSPDASR